MSERQTKAGNQITLSLSLSLTHSHYLTLIPSLIRSLSTCWTTFVFMSMLKSHSLTFTLSHSLTLTLSHSHTLTLSHSLIHSLSRHAEQLLFSCLGSKATRTFSHSHSFSLSHSFNLSFNHSRHAEQVLFSSLCSKVAVYNRKLQWVFFDILFLLILWV